MRGSQARYAIRQPSEQPASAFGSAGEDCPPRDGSKALALVRVRSRSPHDALALGGLAG